MRVSCAPPPRSSQRSPRRKNPPPREGQVSEIADRANATPITKFSRTASGGFWRCAQILREERERAAPGQISRRLVVTGGAGVVVEGVLRARIDLDRVFL